MLPTFRRPVMIAWIALLAILFGALAPAMSQALTSHSGAGDTVQICTADGYKLVKVTVGQSMPPADADLHGGQHCVWCGAHVNPYLLPQNAGSLATAPVRVAQHPRLFYRSPARLSGWTAASPRAPPSAPES